MEHENLLWKEERSKAVFKCRIFSVRESACVSPDNKHGMYMVLDAADWAIVVPVIDTPHGKKFVMVRQWRHGARELSLEFPGGVIEKGEEPTGAAVRELREETAYAAGKITKIGECSPNPAIMSNRVHFFLAENLQNMGKQNLDEDEYVETELISAAEVFRSMGQPPYIHALMGTALSLYLQKTAKDSGLLPANL
ncbi:MAG: NUDIX hydrolase [Treponema sp.]|jgi:8-oxo-dGTP pyrophosphatase MutT (NUDIX family)|nr:NUDIX hydrolase [Treponema sp.]